MKPAAALTTLILCLIAIGHLLRLIFGIEVIADGKVIPLWVSVPGIIVPAALAAALWRESRAR